MTQLQDFESALRAWSAVFMRRSVHAFIVAMKDSGLSMSQLTALIRLHYHGSCPVSAIGEEVGVTTAAASQIADRLAGMGLIERDEDPADRRVRLVRLTAQGRTLVAAGLEARLAWTRQLARRLPGDRIAAVVDALHLLTQAASHLDLENVGPADPRSATA